jgi:hypothetical protein
MSATGKLNLLRLGPATLRGEQNQSAAAIGILPTRMRGGRHQEVGFLREIDALCCVDRPPRRQPVNGG